MFTKKKSSLCRAKNPATCRVHGTPFSSSYDIWVQEHNDVEPAVVFKKITLPTLNLGNNYPVTVRKNGHQMEILFAIEENSGWIPSGYRDEDYMMHLNASNSSNELIADIDKEIAKNRKFAGLPLHSKSEKQKLQRYDILKKAFTNSGVADLIKRQKAIEAVNDLPDVGPKTDPAEGGAYRLSYTAIFKAYNYGKQLDAMSGYSEQEKAVILTQSLEANDKIYHSDYGTPEYHEDVKRNWTVYKTFAAEYEKPSK